LCTRKGRHKHAPDGVAHHVGLVDGAALRAQSADDAQGRLPRGRVSSARPRHEHPQHHLCNHAEAIVILLRCPKVSSGSETRDEGQCIGETADLRFTGFQPTLTENLTVTMSTVCGLQRRRMGFEGLGVHQHLQAGTADHGDAVAAAAARHARQHVQRRVAPQRLACVRDELTASVGGMRHMNSSHDPRRLQPVRPQSWTLTKAH